MSCFKISFLNVQRDFTRLVFVQMLPLIPCVPQPLWFFNLPESFNFRIDANFSAAITFFRRIFLDDIADNLNEDESRGNASERKRVMVAKISHFILFSHSCIRSLLCSTGSRHPEDRILRHSSKNVLSDESSLKENFRKTKL